MSAKKQTNQRVQPKVEVNKVEVTKVVEQTKPILTPSEDMAVQNAKVQSSSVDSNPLEKMDDSRASKEKINEHTKLVDDIESGKVIVSGGTIATDISTIKKPLIPHPISGKPVYETNEAWMKAEALKGNI